MEWVEGVKLNDRKGMVECGIRPREAAIQLLKGFGQMIFIHGFVHAGNIAILKYWTFQDSCQCPQESIYGDQSEKENVQIHIWLA